MMILGIDLGTSSLKAVLTDADETVIAEVSVPIVTRAPRRDWSEQSPEDWWNAFREALASLRAREPHAFRTVRALGLSGQMHAAVLLDRQHKPVRPAILWNDGRAARECEMLQEAVPDLPFIAGAVAAPGFTAPKLLWLKLHEPESFRRAAKVVPAKDFLRLRLSGEAVTDKSDAAGTLWLDERTRDWSDDVLSATGLSRAAMPTLVEGNALAGSVRPAVLQDLGIDGPVVLAGGAGDVAAAAIGIGAVNNGDAFISLGTSAQFFVADERYRPEPQSLLHAFAHALPDRWFRMAAMLNGASCLEWLARIVGESDVGKLLDSADALYRGPSRLMFLPYLSGERTPHNDPHARGVFAGLDHSVEAADLMQAVVEGVAFSLREARLLLEASGAERSAVAAVGGGARSRFPMQVIANVLGIPVARHAGGEKGPALGAARLARMALTGENPERVCVAPEVLDVIEPDPALTSAYAERFESYKELYRVLRSEFHTALTPPL